MLMSSITKVSPPIRDQVPDGFYVDDRTQDVCLLRDIDELEEALEESVADQPFRTTRDPARPLAKPRSEEKRNGKRMRILLVEDNPGDVRLIQEALEETKLAYQLSVTENGMEALTFLHRRGKYTAAARPDLILLDLNLPLKHGREVLEEIKQDVDLRRIPVVVLTTSQAEQDVFKTYDLHANCYVRKRNDLDQFMMVVQLLEAFWFHIVQLSPGR